MKNPGKSHALAVGCSDKNSMKDCKMKTDEQLIGDIECICGALPRVLEFIRRYRALKAENEAAQAEIQDLYDQRRALMQAAPPAPSQAVELSEAEVMRCIADSGCYGTVKMSYESGPSDIDKPSLNATKFARAIIAAKAVNHSEQHLDMVQVCVERGKVCIKRGVQSFMLAYDEEDQVAVEWYVDQLRKALMAYSNPTGDDLAAKLA